MYLNAKIFLTGIWNCATCFKIIEFYNPHWKWLKWKDSVDFWFFLWEMHFQSYVRGWTNFRLGRRKLDLRLCKSDINRPTWKLIWHQNTFGSRFSRSFSTDNTITLSKGQCHCFLSVFRSWFMMLQSIMEDLHQFISQKVHYKPRVY